MALTFTPLEITAAGEWKLGQCWPM